MPADEVAKLLAQGTANAGQLEQANRQAAAANAPQGSEFDVWTHTGTGLEQRLTDPAAEGDSDAALAEGIAGPWARSDLDGTTSSVAAQAADALKQFQVLTGMASPAPGQVGPQGALEHIGATFGLLTSLEQLISAPLAMIPF